MYIDGETGMMDERMKVNVAGWLLCMMLVTHPEKWIFQEYCITDPIYPA